MILMLEGLDRTGKTTLAQALAAELDAPLIHKGAPTAADALTEYLAPLAGHRPGQHLVLDRWHWGEMVWPFVYGRPSLMGSRELRYIDSALAAMGTVAIYCTGNTNQIWKRCVEADEPITREPLGQLKLQQAGGHFDQILARTALPWYRYDFTRVEMSEAVAHIIALGWGAERMLREAVDVG